MIELFRTRHSTIGFGILTVVVIVAMNTTLYAGVAVPYVFTSGTTARASEVNANFDALGNAMPAAKEVAAQDQINFAGIGTISITVNAPSSGQIIVFASGTYWITSVTGAIGKFKLSTGPSDTGPGPGSAEFNHGDNSMHFFNIIRSFPVSSAGTYTFYLNGSLFNDASMSGMFIPVLTAVYIPASL